MMQTTTVIRAGKRALMLPLLWLAAALCSAESIGADDASVKAVPVPHSEELAMRSSKGLEYRIFIYRPASPPPEAGYPVIYVLDGNAWFEPLASAVRLQASPLAGMVPAVVVGVAYPGDKPFNSLRRFYDFIPDVPLVEEVPEGFEPPKIGGGEQFLKFLLEELEPAIGRKVKIDRERRTLFGHSLGCSFALHVLFTQPQAYDDYVCGSPSLYFNGGYVLEAAERFIASIDERDVDADLLLYVAEYDEKLPPSLDPALAKKWEVELKRARVVTGARELYEKLQPLEKAGLDTIFMEIEKENHISVVPVLINRMLPIVLEPRQDR